MKEKLLENLCLEKDWRRVEESSLKYFTSQDLIVICERKVEINRVFPLLTKRTDFQGTCGF